MISSPDDFVAIPKIVYAAPGALFPLMALFIWLDTDRYRAYLPLFAAGKCIVVVSLLGWSIVSQRFTITTGGELSGAKVLEWIILSGDFLAMAIILLINKNVHRLEAEVN